MKRFSDKAEKIYKLISKVLIILLLCLLIGSTLAQVILLCLGKTPSPFNTITSVLLLILICGYTINLIVKKKFFQSNNEVMPENIIKLDKQHTIALTTVIILNLFTLIFYIIFQCVDNVAHTLGIVFLILFIVALSLWVIAAVIGFVFDNKLLKAKHDYFWSKYEAEQPIANEDNQ